MQATSSIALRRWPGPPPWHGKGAPGSGPRQGHAHDAAEDAASDATDARGGTRRVLLCARCRLPITTGQDRIQVHERHEHTCTNPHGHAYRIGCFRAAPGCAGAGAPQTYFSWFPGYSWQIVLCRACHTHLGWLFRAGERCFHGLILDRLVPGEDDDGSGDGPARSAS